METWPSTTPLIPAARRRPPTTKHRPAMIRATTMETSRSTSRRIPAAHPRARSSRTRHATTASTTTAMVSSTCLIQGVRPARVPRKSQRPAPQRPSRPPPQCPPQHPPVASASRRLQCWLACSGCETGAHASHEGGLLPKAWSRAVRARRRSVSAARSELAKAGSRAPGPLLSRGSHQTCHFWQNSHAPRMPGASWPLAATYSA